MNERMLIPWDELTKGQMAELKDFANSTVNSGEDILRYIEEHCTRPPKPSAVEEMDYAVTHNSADIAVKWQAVKKEREL